MEKLCQEYVGASGDGGDGLQVNILTGVRSAFNMTEIDATWLSHAKSSPQRNAHLA